MNLSAARDSAAPRSCCAPYDRATLVVTATALLLATRAGPAKGSAWTVADNADRLCGNLTLCTASNLTWPVATVYDAVSGCTLLKRKGLENLHFFGASQGILDVQGNGACTPLASHSSVTFYCQSAYAQGKVHVELAPRSLTIACFRR